MDFSQLPNVFEGRIKNPFAGKIDDNWVEGNTSIVYLNNKFGKFESVDEMIEGTKIESEKLFLYYLRDKGILH